MARNFRREDREQAMLFPPSIDDWLAEDHFARFIRETIASLDEDGRLMRRLYDLRLVRETSPLLALTWTVMHEIDEDSPLFGEDAAALVAQDVALLVTIKGTEDRLSTTVHARHAYLAEHILFDRRYTDILRESDEGERYVDYRVFHDHEPS